MTKKLSGKAAIAGAIGSAAVAAVSGGVDEGVQDTTR